VPQGWTLLPPKKPSVDGWTLEGTNDPGTMAQDAPIYPSTPYGTDGGGGYGPDGINIPGSTPDYKGLIGTDPGLLQLQGDLAAGGIADAAARDAAYQRGIIQFGEVPTGISGMNLGNAAQLAQQNTAAGLSTVARLSTQHQDAVRTITNALAGRGLIRSGETGYQQGREDTRYTQTQYDARQKLLDYFSQVQGSFTQSERARQAAYAMGISQAEMAQLAMHPPTPGMVATRGSDGLYHTPDGRTYNPDGSPYTGGSVAPPPQAPQAPTYQPFAGVPAPPPPPSAPSPIGMAGGVQLP
jgi:hypothetical protein